MDWVIVGESTGARPMKANWVKRSADNCQANGVAFFFKQWGGVFKKSGRLLDGRTWDDLPLPVFPAV